MLNFTVPSPKRNVDGFQTVIYRHQKWESPDKVLRSLIHPGCINCRVWCTGESPAYPRRNYWEVKIHQLRELRNVSVQSEQNVYPVLLMPHEQLIALTLEEFGETSEEHGAWFLVWYLDSRTELCGAYSIFLLQSRTAVH